MPVEIGDHYLKENWNQKLITLEEFIEKYIENKTNEIGYLAQTQLFDQIPELKKGILFIIYYYFWLIFFIDICIPIYCNLTSSDDIDVIINAWFGPEGTISPSKIIIILYEIRKIFFFVSSLWSLS